MATLTAGQLVVVNMPGNERLHDQHATVKEVRPRVGEEGVYYLLSCPLAATGEIRALDSEVYVLRSGGILNTNTTGTTHEAARASGFTGDACPNCGSAMMVRNGACLLCKTCGQTTGCS